LTVLTAFVDCPACGTTYEGVWQDDSITDQDRDQAPVARQACPACLAGQDVEYPGWSWRSEAG
jgi:hypothetical protein